MDSTLETFLKEINEIAPPKQSKEACVWKECYDELTGYPYYWNMKTDEVTWEKPANFVLQKKSNSAVKHDKKPSSRHTSNPVVPVVSSKVPEDSGKIYSIGNTNQDTHTQNSSRHLKRKDKSDTQKKAHKSKSDSDDEKITLITSYGGDSESETEPEPEPVHKKKKSYDKDETELLKHDSYPSDDDDDVDILTKIQKRAKELKALGGDLPPEVAKIADIPKSESAVQLKDKNKKDIAGFSLIAGYSDSEDENEEIKTVFSTKPEVHQPQTSHSTLFPITKPVNVTDFIQSKVQENKTENNNDFDTKSFQRKKRIGVALVNTGKKKDISGDDDNERRGFGFSANSDVKPVEKGNLYPGFAKGGVMFVKSDVLNPSLPKNEESNCDNNSKKTEEEVINKQEIIEMYHLLVEKLKFLNEGRPEVSPTQIMVIQAQMLFEAMKNDGLKPKYLETWLNDTCSELIKLEKDATPEGWLLQWDRTHKRYYYLQPATGASQWEYPVETQPAPPHPPPAQADDDAMDISTTPPPEQIIRLSPPLPPIIRSPTPPPPPVISQPEDREEDERVITVLPDVPLPPNPHPILPSTNSINGEPLPPGVDLPDIVSSKETDKGTDSLNSELDSFYSEVAAIDTPKSISPQPILSAEAENSQPEINGDKKKKKKVKLAPGLSLKKKGVSQLVEKWKNVQQQFHD